jgi:hypothetical protein
MFNFADNATKRDSIIEVFQLLVDKSDVNIACYSTKVNYYIDEIYCYIVYYIVKW